MRGFFSCAADVADPIANPGVFATFYAMIAFFVFLLGALVFGATFSAWVWLNGFGCGMNTTGCNGFSLNWSDWEALSLFLPTFGLGAGFMIWGICLWIWRAR